MCWITAKQSRRWMALTVIGMLLSGTAFGQEAIEIGGRLEPLVDAFLIERFSGKAELRMHTPIPREVAIVHDAPWEGTASGYHTVFRDGDLYRMYYRGHQMELRDDKLVFPHRELVCYAESRDGMHWTKPNLGLVEFEGSRRNNILRDAYGTHNFTPMKDTNPDAKPGERYKALGGVKGAKEGDGLFAFQSDDGIHWSLMRQEPVITDGYFDSQNLAFWDSGRGEYRAYIRDFRDGRDIKTCTSDDFVHWTAPIFLGYPAGRKTQLYTNQVIPYYRAPHVLLGFPTRYVTGRGLLTPLNELIARAHPRYGNDYTDGGFMTSRDRVNFHVWDEPLLRPGPVREGRWLYGGNYQSWGIVETQATTGPKALQPLLPKTSGMELSIYASEGGWVGTSNRMRRYTLRIDGFVSAYAPMTGGELLTKPLLFQGKELTINFATSAAGSVRIELQSSEGRPLDGYSLEDCPEIFGDDVAHTVAWKNGTDVSKLSGKPVRLRFALQDADVYALRFGQ